MKSILCSVLILGGLFAVGCNNNVAPPSGVLKLPPQPETTIGLTASIGDGQVRLAWHVNNPSAVSRYKIYFSDSSATAAMYLLDSTAESQYAVSGLVNGRQYYFRVSAVAGYGLEGLKSTAIAAVPGVFAINIDGGRQYTNSRQVTITPTAPGGTDLIQLAHDSTFAGAQWENLSSAIDFELSDGDGMKVVYARFQLNGGGNSIRFVADSIRLDRVAMIRSVTESSAGAILRPGDTVHFMVDAGEPGGTASVTIPGLGEIQLNDNGLGGDRTRDDGRYEADYIIPVATELNQAEVTGKFTDAAGNRAADVKAATRLTATFAPDPVPLRAYPISSMEIMLEWSKSTIGDFAAYRLFRSMTSSVDQTSALVTSITNANTTSYRDTGLADTTLYYYRLYVFDGRGNSAPSTVVAMPTAKNVAPDSIFLAAARGADSLAVDVTWEEAGDADFASYYLIRDITPPVTFNPARVIKVLGQRGTTSVGDKVPAAGTYYYQIYVVDKQELKTGSNIVVIVIP